MARKLRISASVFFAVVTGGLCIWWWGAIHMNEGLNLFGLGNDPRSLDLFLYGAFLSSVAAGVPWIPNLPSRFSLRAMLIVTTLLAIVLGLGVWLAS